MDVSSQDSELAEADFKHNRFLMQRYSLIEQVKAAEIIGIVMGTLSAS